MTADLSGSYDRWHNQFGTDDGDDPPWHQLVKRHLDNVLGAAVLEIGCGRGGFARWLEGKQPSSFVAADLSRSALEKARSITHQRVTYELADIQQLPHPDASFDLVISCETIEHVPDPRQAVSELARVLSPGGRLFLTTPNYLNLMGCYRAYRRVVGRPFTEEGQPINNLTMVPRTFSWMRSAGLRSCLVDACGHYIPIPGRNPPNWTALDGPKPGLKWFASNQLLVATKGPSRGRS
ncbi:MAG: hypothetical protein DLM70_00850 [Chloroflexi bacterium]|nr:MAG: hypothetical protein DLM70_00850 [Chloroflexota bacterium]